MPYAISDIVREYCPSRRTARVRTNSLGCSVFVIEVLYTVVRDDCGPINWFYINVVCNTGPTLKGIYGLEFQANSCPLGYTVIESLYS